MPAKNTVRQGLKLILIKRFFEEYTDENRVVSLKDVDKYLIEKEIITSGMDRKTYYNLFKALDEHCGVSIEYDAKRHGYRLTNPSFSAEDLKDIVNCIQSAKFITQGRADYLSSHFASRSNAYERESLLRTKAYVTGRVGSDKKSPLRLLDEIYYAISINSNIKFEYAFYAPNASSKEIFIKFKKNIVEYEASPFAVFWEDGNIYLRAFVKDKNDFRSFRLDRMESVETLIHNKREGKMEFQKSQNANKRKAVVFSMYSSNEPTMVKIRFVNTEANRVVDKLGKDIRMTVVDKSHFEISELIELSPPFYAWLSSFGNKAYITFPPKAQEGMKNYLEKAIGLYKYEEEHR